MSTTKRAIRIAGVSGGVFDRFRAIEDFSKDPSIDVIFGDWISEVSMTLRGSQKLDEIRTGTSTEAYEQSFITMLSPGIQNIEKHGQKVVVNAGACDPEAMAQYIQQLCKDKGTELKVSWVTGDNVTEQFQKRLKNGDKFLSLPADTPIQDWNEKPIFAQAYLGGIGIVEALRHGADIVICGRVSDASPVIGAAMWWHNWARDDFDKLANALVAGHLIECSSSQLLYEIQGPLYYNSDVTARIDGIRLVQESADHVRVEGVQGFPPPPTTKIGITAHGGWQAEFHYFLTGLDIEEKAKMVEAQTIASMGEYRKEFTTLSFNVTGSRAPLGSIVHGRSGDKSSDCNVGFWARDDEEWDWLRSMLTIKEMQVLLDKEYNGGAIERFEIRGVRAVHFLLRDHLDRGVNSSSSYDVLGKLVAEYLRCKQVDIPIKFIEKGTI
ncbi:MAG: hypothetical protein STHCBS139747_007492 [Sporothrix thermara]